MACILYIYDKEEWSLNSDVKIIATILNFQNDVRWKSSSNLAWKQVRKNIPLQVGDSIYSGDHSKIEISFKNKEKLILNSNSLLQLEDVQLSADSTLKSVNLKLPYGHIEIKSNDNIKWKIQNQKDHLEVNSNNPSQYNIEINENHSFKIASKMGEINVLHHGKLEKLDPTTAKSKIFNSENELNDINNFDSLKNKDQMELNGVTDPSLQSKTDEANRLKVEKDTKTDALKDKVDAEIKLVTESQNSNNQINDPTPSNVKKSSKISSTNESKRDQNLNLPSVKNTDTKTLQNIKDSNPFEAPETTIPFHDSTIHLYKGSKLTIHFTWREKDKKIKEFVIQLSDNDLFKPILLTKVVNTNKVDIELPREGKYYWKVLSLHGKIESPWSQTKFFTVEYVR